MESIINASGIYTIHCLANDKYYVGQSVNLKKRIREHSYYLSQGEHYNQFLQRSWDKYGCDSFEFHVVELCDGDALDDREIYYIEHYDSYRNGYNLTTGGHGHRGFSPSKETREKIRQRVLANPTRCSGSDNWKSQKVVLLNTREVFDCIAEASDKYGINRGNISACCRKKKSYAGKINEERCVWVYYTEYVSMTDDDIAKMFSIANHAKRGVNHHAARKVLLTNTGEVFNTIKDAAATYSVQSSSISFCCTGKIQSAGKLNGVKLVWQYIDT